MINKSIAYRLSIYVSLAVIAVFLAFILLSYNYNQKLIKENITNQAKGQSMGVIMQIEKLLVSTREITSNISGQILYYDKNGDTDLFVKALMAKYPYLSAIHINLNAPNLSNRYFYFRENDSIIHTKNCNPVLECEVERLVFDTLADYSRALWSEPFRCERSGNVVVSFYIPITITTENNQEIKVGNAISELSLLDLNDTINKIQVGKRGFAFVIANNGDYITHPYEPWILERNIFEISEKIYDSSQANPHDILNNKESGWVIAYPEMLNYEKTWIYYTPIKETNWVLIFAVPYHELFEPLYISLLQMMFISVLGMLAIYLIVTYITNKLIQPLSKVTEKLKKFSNLSGEKDIQTLNEVKQVAESLDYLQDWYKSYQSSLHKEKQRNVERHRDLLQASEIQQSLIKTDFPAFPERKDIDLAAIYKPAKIVSGDLYDFFFVDDENLIITMGDVSGKGIPAAIFMSVAQTIIKGNSSYKRPRTIVNKTNRELYTKNQHQFFLTLFLGVFNVKTGVLSYCNAAHTTSYIVKETGTIIELNQSHGLPVGLYPDKEYNDKRITIEKGDSLILYSDGIVERQDENKKHFGSKRFKKRLKELSWKNPETVVYEINNELERFSENAEQNDDISLLVLKYHP